MARYTPKLDNGRLVAWKDLHLDEWPTLLLGNGFSQSVWPAFGYDSLFDVARRMPEPFGLSDRAIALFDELDTSNFESVLESLIAALTVSRGLKLSRTDRATIQSTQDAIRSALGEAVAEVHVPWTKVHDSVLPAIHQELQHFAKIFTTNYDLLIYWAIMAGGDPMPFVDFFWSSGLTFDPFGGRELPGRLPVYYLHGAVHLRRDVATGTTSKIPGSDVWGILDTFAAHSTRSVPLIVTEGRAEDKERLIASSAYLSFCADEFSTIDGGVFVVGHALSPVDNHIIRMLRSPRAGSVSSVAVSVRKKSRKQTMDMKLAIAKALGSTVNVTFVDAATIPLLQHRVT